MNLEEARLLAETDGRVSHDLREHKCNHFDEVVEALEQISRHKTNGRQSMAASVALGVLAKVKEVKL